MNPEPTIPCFIDRPVLSAWKVMSQILAQDFGFRRLAKRFVLPVLSKDTHAPTLFVHIQPDVNGLTREIKFATLIHGKSPFFGWILWVNKIIAEFLRLAFVSIRPSLKGQCLFESYPHGVESGKILA
jgi:hypothetical protein